MAHYEYPLNERSRVLLRLEYIFARAQHHLSAETIWDTQAAIDSLVSCVNVFNTNLKSELLKDLDRNLTILRKQAKNSEGEMPTLEQTMLALETSQQNLLQLTKPIGAEVREDDFFKTIMQRSAIPGGTCSFDLPQFHLWLTQPSEVRIQTLNNWFNEFLPVRITVAQLLSLYRANYSFQTIKVEHGTYQQNLDPSQSTQFVYLEIADDLNLFPEVSGNKHRINIRFRNLELSNLKISNYEEGLNFRFALSIL
jgi:cell division protein ZapD